MTFDVKNETIGHLYGTSILGTYKVRNEIETKRNEINENETKRNETKRNQRNETKSTKWKRNETKPTK